jgi:MFS family permease
MLLKFPPSLKHRRFRLLWLGLMFSMAGSQMQVAALHWHIRELTGEPDPLALGGIGLARFLPIMIFALVGGAIADKVDRRRVLFLTQGSMALVALAYGVLTFTGRITLWHIYALTALQAVAVAFDLPARQSLVPNLVPARDLPNAFSMSSIAFQVGAIGGPALSGLVIAVGGLAYTYLFNALSFLGVIVALMLIGPVEQDTVARAGGASYSGRPNRLVSLGAIREGVQFILTHPIILSTMILDFFATFFSSANTLMPIVARDILRVGEVEYGWLVAAQPIGATLAALAISQIPQIRRQGPVFLVSVVAFGLTTIVFGLAGGFAASPFFAFALAMLALVGMGASDSVSTIIRNTIRQLQTPDYIRGRMVSINQLFFQGGPQLGEVEAGAVAALFSTPFAIVSGGVGCILAVLGIVRFWPQLLHFNGDEPVLAGDPSVRPQGDPLPGG